MQQPSIYGVLEKTTTDDDDDCSQKAFRSIDGKCFCNKCRQYKNEDEFNPSWVLKKQRQCKSCWVGGRKRKVHGDPVQLLLVKLKRRLHYLGYSNISTGLSQATINTILDINGVDDPTTVERIISPKTFAECLNVECFKVKYK